MYKNRVFIGYKRFLLVSGNCQENAPKCNRTVTICYNGKPGELHASGAGGGAADGSRSGSMATADGSGWEISLREAAGREQANFNKGTL